MARRILRPDMAVRQIARDWPETRPIFERFGLAASRPPYGPLLSLEAFAKRQGIPLDQLLRELAEAADADVELTRNTVHRAFLATALFYAVFIGGGLGLWMAYAAGREGGYEFVPARHAFAHGVAQQWGFLTLFIVGIAFRWLPMATSADPPSRRLASLIVVLGALGAGFLYVWGHAEGLLPWLGPLGAACLLGFALLVFAEFVRLTQVDQKRQTWNTAIILGCCWLCVTGGLTSVFALTVVRHGPDAFDPFVRLLLADLPLVGFVVNCIYGFGLRILPPLVGGPVRQRYAPMCVLFHNVGVFTLLAGRLTAWPYTTALTALFLVGAALLYLAALPRLKRPRVPSDRPEQGPRVSVWIIAASFAWAVVGAGLYAVAGYVEFVSPLPTLAAIRVYGPGLAPMALYDAARHAITLGFMTGLIIGVGSRLIPMLEHRVLYCARAIPVAALCLETGVSLRIVGDVWSLVFGKQSLYVQSAAAILALLGLALFGLAAVRTLWPPADSLLKHGRVTERTPVVLLLEECPAVYEYLVRRGARYLARARSVPPELTLGSMLRSEGLEVHETLGELQRLVDACRSDQTVSGNEPRTPSSDAAAEGAK